MEITFANQLGINTYKCFEYKYETERVVFMKMSRVWRVHAS